MGSVIKRFLNLTIKKKKKKKKIMREKKKVAACDCPAFPVEIGGKNKNPRKKNVC